jgi:ABC-type multidrug transport system ATPase subunit
MTESTSVRLGVAEQDAGSLPAQAVGPAPLTRASLPESPARVIDADNVVRRFGDTVALDGVSLAIRAGEIHALLGPNGAGKTTLMRILTGLVEADSGKVVIAGCDPNLNTRTLRRRVGLVPSGDRSLYLRLTGIENLLFFARLQGIPRRPALVRVTEAIEQVGLTHAARVRVGVYSHGMQKRLAIARGLITYPTVLLVDEATHDLDPEAAENIRSLVRALAARGTAIVWTTQRVDEVRGFADNVTLLAYGRVRFAGTVPELMAHALPRRYLLQLARRDVPVPGTLDGMQAALAGLGSIAPTADGSSDHYLLSLDEQVLLGEALARISAAGYDLLGCRDERSEIEEAFLSLTREADA